MKSMLEDGLWDGATVFFNQFGANFIWSRGRLAAEKPGVVIYTPAGQWTKLNGTVGGFQQQSRNVAAAILGSVDLYEFFDDFDRTTAGATVPSGWTGDVSGGSTVQNNSSSAEIGGTFLSVLTAVAASRANIYDISQNVNPGTKDMYVAFRMSVLSGVDSNSIDAMGIMTTSLGRYIVAGAIGFLSTANFFVQYNGQVITSGGVGIDLAVPIDAAYHLFEFWIIGTALFARIDGGPIKTTGTAISGYTPKSGYCSICQNGATAAVRSHEGSWMYVASLK